VSLVIRSQPHGGFTILAAILTFSDRLIYSAYARVPVDRLSALDDQSIAGVIMRVPGALIFLFTRCGWPWRR
jgi:Cytochrome c oxidase caa3 assembly factor (Caa3_CtaG)